MSLHVRAKARVGTLGLDASLDVEAGESVAVLGPNGAGKTTLLRVIAGLLPLDEGAVVLDGEVLEDTAAGVRLPPRDRPIGVVFQDYLLFPHLSALQNVAFGVRGSRRHARSVAAGWLTRMGLGDRATDKPSALSGGQAQRVALARALAPGPRLLLLDEPLAALDAGVRVELRHQLAEHLSGFEGVHLLVTHDPIEAMALADRLVILEEGRVVQTGSPADVTAQPRSRFVADLVGVNLLRGRAAPGGIEVAEGSTIAVAEEAHGEVFVVVHPHAVGLHRVRPEGSARNVWELQVAGLETAGGRVRVRLRGRLTLVAEVTPAAVRELELAAGGSVYASVKATEVAVYPA